MNDPIIACFQEEFERFCNYCLEQIKICPDELWNRDKGEFPLWLHHLHTFSWIEYSCLPDTPKDAPETSGRPAFYPVKAVMLSREPGPTVSRQDMLVYVGAIKERVNAWFAGLDAGTLGKRHERLSSALGKERTVEHALISIVRHINYHLGCCDAVLREHCLTGVY